MSSNQNRANGYLSQVLPAIDELLTHLEDAKTRYSDPLSTVLISQHQLTMLGIFLISVHPKKKKQPEPLTDTTFFSTDTTSWRIPQKSQNPGQIT